MRWVSLLFFLAMLLPSLQVWAGEDLTIVGEGESLTEIELDEDLTIVGEGESLTEIELDKKLFKLSGFSAQRYREKKCHKRSLKIVADSPICTQRGVGLINMCHHPSAKKWLWFEGEVLQLTAICMKGIFFDERIIDGVLYHSEWPKMLANVDKLQPLYLSELAISENDLGLVPGAATDVISPEEMLVLGNQYLEGNKVIQDYVMAHKWFNLAATKGSGKVRDKATEQRLNVTALLTPSQIGEAQKLARKWMAEYSQK